MRVPLMHGDDLPHAFAAVERVRNARPNPSALQPEGPQCLQELTIPDGSPSPQPTPTGSSPQRPLQAHLRPSSPTRAHAISGAQGADHQPFSLSSTLDALSQPLEITVNAALSAAAPPADAICLQILRSNGPAEGLPLPTTTPNCLPNSALHTVKYITVILTIALIVAIRTFVRYA